MDGEGPNNRPKQVKSWLRAGSKRFPRGSSSKSSRAARNCGGEGLAYHVSILFVLCAMRNRCKGLRGAQRRDPGPCTNLLAMIVLNILKLDDPELRQVRAQAR
jgi:hypothetical protein